MRPDLAAVLVPKDSLVNLVSLASKVVQDHQGDLGVRVRLGSWCRTDRTSLPPLETLGFPEILDDLVKADRPDSLVSRDVQVRRVVQALRVTSEGPDRPVFLDQLGIQAPLVSQVSLEIKASLEPSVLAVFLEASAAAAALGTLW